MNLDVQPPPKPEKNGLDRSFTGFPEPLSPNSNTTLRHPDADTSHGASIEAADVPLSRAQSRVRIPGLHRKTQSLSITAFGKSDFGSRPSTSLSSTASKEETSNKVPPQPLGAREVNTVVNGVNGLNGYAHGEANGYSPSSNKSQERRHWFRKSWHKV